MSRTLIAESHSFNRGSRAMGRLLCSIECILRVLAEGAVGSGEEFVSGGGGAGERLFIRWWMSLDVTPGVDRLAGKGNKA